MKVKFLIPMGGIDILYSPEEIVEVSTDFGYRLIDKGIAELVVEPIKKVEKVKEEKPKAKKKK